MSNSARFAKALAEARTGRFRSIEKLLSEDKLFDEHNNTLLHYAVKHKNVIVRDPKIGFAELAIKLWERLIRDHSNLCRVKNNNGFTASHYAAQYGNLEALCQLESSNGEVNNKGVTPLMLAARHGNLQCVEYLAGLYTEDNINRLCSKRYSAVCYAANNGHFDIVRYLVRELGATINGSGPLFTNAFLLQEICSLDDSSEFFNNLAFSRSDTQDFQYMLACYMSSYRHSSYLGQRTGNSKYEQRKEYLHNNGWCLLKTSEELEIINEHGYYGVAYFKEHDDNTIEVLIAHRGTCLNEPGNIKADYQILEKIEPEILRSASSYMEKLGLNNANITIHGKRITKITHTGFSLGGFIAGALVVQNNRDNSYAVTFDAPGCSYLCSHEQLSRFKSSFRNYVLDPNLVNTCCKHVGPVRHLIGKKINSRRESGVGERFTCDSKAAVELLNTSKSHDLDLMISSFEREQCILYRKVKHWSYAKNIVEYGPFNSDASYLWHEGNGWFSMFFNVASSVHFVAKSIGSNVLWDSTQRISSNGEREGVVAVKHIRSGFVTYGDSYEDRIIDPDEPSTVDILSRNVAPAPLVTEINRKICVLFCSDPQQKEENLRSIEPFLRGGHRLNRNSEEILLSFNMHLKLQQEKLLLNMGRTPHAPMGMDNNL